MIIPPADLSLDDARTLFTGEGIIPDTPFRESRAPGASG